MKKYLPYFLIMFIGIAIGCFLGNYKWDYQSEERYCHKCGLTQVLEKENSIFEELTKGQFGEHKSFLSAYLDESSSCNHDWNIYKRFPINIESAPDIDLENRIAMIYWYNWNDMNEWTEGQHLISNMYQNNPKKTTELLKKSFNPDNLIGFDDVIGIFKLDMSWEEKWSTWDYFLNNYNVYRKNGTAQASFKNTEGTTIITWNFDGGSYTRTFINWSKLDIGE